MTRDLILALICLVAVLLIAAAHKPRIAVTVSPEIEAAAQRIIKESRHD